VKVERELRVCGDCLEIIANGESDHLSESEFAAVAAGLARLGSHVVAGSDEFGFCRTPCECCERPEYGDRYAAAILAPETQAEPSPSAAPETAGKPLVERLAAHLDAMGRTAGQWRDYHESAIEWLCKEHLPSGSGFDSGSALEIDASRADRLVIQTSFHHMSESGYYDGWTQHRVIVSPSFVLGFDLKVTGRDKRGIKDYIGETFQQALSSAVPDYRLDD
jgi:hypothetical protein